jgi:predicted DNA-binding transcriptional regulator YafY
MPRKITPRLAMEVHGVAYVVAYSHQSGIEKTFRLDRILGCWFTSTEGKGTSRERILDTDVE